MLLAKIGLTGKTRESFYYPHANLPANFTKAPWTNLVSVFAMNSARILFKPGGDLAKTHQPRVGLLQRGGRIPGPKKIKKINNEAFYKDFYIWRTQNSPGVPLPEGSVWPTHPSTRKGGDFHTLKKTKPQTLWTKAWKLELNDFDQTFQTKFRSINQTKPEGKKNEIIELVFFRGTNGNFVWREKYQRTERMYSTLSLRNLVPNLCSLLLENQVVRMSLLLALWTSGHFSFCPGICVVGIKPKLW